tara:strand:+ start:2374 stop:6270 length:3897 start_codon:yes stop_codon:yes gene_type:complete
MLVMAESNIARIIRENNYGLQEENSIEMPVVQDRIIEDPFGGTNPNFVPSPPEKSTSPVLNPIAGESNIDRIIRENQLGSTVIAGNNKIVDLESVFSEYKDSLTKEDILDNSNLMEVVYTSLEARRKPSKIMGNIAYKGATTITGGDTGGEGVFGPRDYRKMKKEDAFEIWQNYQRSFAGGQTVTTANEIAYGMSADEKTQRRLGAGYYLFDKMDNVFTGKGSMAEMGDAIWDYTKAGIYDPATILSFGVGKLLSFGATKASSAAARSLLIKGYQQYLKNGMTKTAARQAVAKVVAKSAPITAADAMINMGADVAYQSQLIDAGAQEEYSKAQTAFSAAGAMFIPAAYAGSAAFGALRKSGKMDWAFIGYKQLDDDVFKLGKEEAKRLLDLRVDKVSISSTILDNFDSRNKNLLNWEDAKIVAKEGITKRNEKVTDIVLTDAFYKRFFFGDPENKQKGFWEALKDGGFVVHKTMLEDNTRTGVYGEAIKDYLSDAAAEKAMKNFEKASGEKLGIAYNSKALSDHFVNRTSTAGSILWTPSQLSRLDNFNNSGLINTVGKKMGSLGEMIGKDGGNLGLNAKEALEAFGSSKGAKDSPSYGSFGLSIYKRMITSHLSTSGANLKGFSQLVSLNTAADFFTAAANLSQAGFQKAWKGDADKAAMYYNRAWGSATGAIRRGASVLSPDLEYDYAVKILEEFPETANKLFRDIAGDGGVNDSLKHFNLDAKGKLNAKGKLINPKATLDPKSPIYKTAKTVDAVTKGAQTISLVRLQDEVTKTWAFGTNVNQAIMREYGVLPEKFLSRPDVSLEMATSRFKTNVLEKATFRTLRETASVNWSTLPTNNAFRSAATWIEYATNKTPIGLVVPFGSFLNTTIATMADLSGANAFRFGVYNKLLKKDLDFVTQEGAESFGKMAAGWTAIGVGLYGANGAYERIKEGLSYNQDRNNDGSIEDRTFDWPYSTIRLTSQIIAHATLNKDPDTDFLPISADKFLFLKGFKWDQVPPDLLRELRMQLGGQSLRDLTDFEKSLAEYGINIAAASQGNEGAIELVSNLTGSIVMPVLSKVAAGVTRPLDPVNQVYGLLTDANMNPDMKQGPENWNKSLRYINNLFDGLAGMSSELPTKATPTRGTSKNIDAGKQLLGVRGGQGEPNGIESMLNAAGKSSWRTISFKTEPAVRNYMNKLIAPFLDTAARKFLAKNPEYYSMSLADKELVIQKVIAEAKKNVNSIMKNSPIPRSLEVVRILSKENKGQLKKVMSLLGIEGTLSEILEGENPLETLNQIKILMESYEDIWHGDLELD